MHVKPLHDHIVVELIYKNAVASDRHGLAFDVRETPSGIAIPDMVDNEPSEARVLALGDGRRADGTVLAFEVAVGDRVLFVPWAAITVLIEGAERHVITERDILAKIIE